VNAKSFTQKENLMNRNTLALVFIMLAAISVTLIVPAQAQFTLVKISTDKFTNSDSVHKTEVEPDFFSWGNTIVGTFHVARVPGSIGWGSADVGWATSTDAGKTWTYGILPALTDKIQERTVRLGSRPLSRL
jgi:hypothetical protein